MQVTLSRRFRTIQVYPKDMGGGARPQSAELSMNSRNPPVHRSLSASRPKIGRNAAIAKRWATATQLTVLEPCVELELEPRQQHLRDAGVDLAHEGADAHGADHESPVGRKARHDPRRRRLAAVVHGVAQSGDRGGGPCAASCMWFARGPLGGCSAYKPIVRR